MTTRARPDTKSRVEERPGETGTVDLERSQPEFAEFPEEEFQGRYARLRAQMSRYGLDALMATSEANFRYLTGAHNQRWRNVLRPHAALLPLVGDPVIMQAASDNNGLRTVTWIRDLRGFDGPRVKDGYGTHLIRLIAETLADKGIRSGRIGIERDWQMRAGLSIDDFARLEKQLAPIELVDAAPIWWEVRATKSPLEVDCIRRAAQITSAAYRDLRKEIQIGMTESEIERRFCALLMQHGAERPTYIPVNCHAGRWPKSEHLVFGLSTARKLPRDGIVDMDGGCTYKGYWADFSRMFAVGTPPEKARLGYRVAQEAINAGIDAIRPGRPITEVYHAMASVIAKGGAVGDVLNNPQSGINGHGLGLDATERPYVNATDPTILTPGVFFCIEPIFSLDGYGVVLGEEMVVVTETGYEILSDRAPSELPIVA